MRIFNTQISVARSFHSNATSVLCGLILSSLASSAFAAEAKVVADQILDEAVPKLQLIMQELARGCGGGAQGKAPLNWGERQKPGNLAINEFNEARRLLKADKNVDAVEHLNAGRKQLSTLINSLKESCDDGPHGEDPPSYGNYVRFRDVTDERLATVIRFLK